MKLYPSTTSTPRRLRFGERLVRGLSRLPQTAPLADTVRLHNASLRAAHEARVALEPAVEDRSDDVRFGEVDAESFARRLNARCRELDGDRAGAVTRVGFPDGLSVVLAPQGEAQGQSFQRLRTAYAESADPTVAAHRDELVGLADKAIAAFVPAYAAWVDAVRARDAAFTVELLRRREHRRAVNAVFGAIRSAFPEDRRLQDAIVPDLAVARGRSAEDEDDGDDGPAPTDPEL